MRRGLLFVATLCSFAHCALSKSVSLSAGSLRNAVGLHHPPKGMVSVNNTASKQHVGRNLAGTTTSHNPHHHRVVFYAMGDAPYGNKARDKFPDMIERLESRGEFLVHLGDVKERQQKCDLHHFSEAADALLSHAHRATFIIPGDNDWYECLDQNTTWNEWSRTFLRFQDNWLQHSFEVRHQSGREENFAFSHKGVLFVGLHVIHAAVRDEDIWNDKVNDDADWLEEQITTYGHDPTIGAIVLFCHAYPHHRRYEAFYDKFVQLTEAVAKPVLYLQGDTHKFKVDHKFPPRNVMRVVVDRGGTHDPTEVTVDPFGDVPFKFKRRPLPGK